MLDYINPFSENFILKGVLDFLVSMLDYINPFSENFILKSVLNFLGSMLDYINPFSENFFGLKLIELFSDLLNFLFIPKEESINNLVVSVQSKFAFVDSIKIAISSLQNMFENVISVPKFTIDVDATDYTEATKLTILDLSWYIPFKPYGDLIITGFVYLMFLWRLYITLPSIISGAGGLSHVSEVSEHFSSRGGD